MAKKRTWKEHALDYIKATKKCPGELPPTGTLDELFTHEQFMSMVVAVGPHEWDSCCFVEEILGLSPTDQMKRLDVDSVKVLKDLSELKPAVVAVDRSAKLKDLKQRLHTYVDRIDFKSSGALYVPNALVKLETYINSFFS